MARQQVNGDEIRRIRVEVLDLDMDEFLKALSEEGIVRHPDTIRNVELGRQQPSDKLLNAIARVLGVRRQTLLLQAPRAVSDTTP